MFGKQFMIICMMALLVISPIGTMYVTGSEPTLTEGDPYKDPGAHNTPFSNELAPFHANAFCANYGQLDSDEIRFYSQDAGIWFFDNGLWLLAREYDEVSAPDPGTLATALRYLFVGANRHSPEGRQPVPGYTNFLLGNDTARWRTDVPSFAEVYYENLYDGIDLRYYIKQGGLKYDFIVKPGADPSQIRIRCQGACGLLLDQNDDLRISTGTGSIKDGALFIYQDIDGERRTVDGRFEIMGRDEFGFELAGYDRSETLIIDPYIEYSTYFGGSLRDRATGIDTDNAGQTYITGYTFSSNIPESVGMYDPSYNGDYDAFVAKLAENGSEVVFTTYLGGGLDDRGNDIAVDEYLYVHVTGYTKSASFPITMGIPHAGDSDMFILRLSNTGKSLHYSRFMGGLDTDVGRKIALTYEKTVLITGYTSSFNFPTTSEAVNRSHNGGVDVVVLRLDSNGDVVFSTYIGGTGDDYGYSIVRNAQGDPYVTGSTNSLDFPTTTGAYSENYNLNNDAFVFWLSGDGTQFKSSTFLGGSASDIAHDIKIDKNGNVVVVGITHSDDFPIHQQNNFYSNYLGGGDIFVTKLYASLADIFYSTYMGGSEEDEAFALSFDPENNLYVAGSTQSADMILSKNATDHSYNKNTDGFVLKLSPVGKVLLYGTFIGGTNFDHILDMTTDRWNHIYMTGYTGSLDYPVTDGALDETYNSNDDVFITKISLEDYIEITSAAMYIDTFKVSRAYSEYGVYTFRIKITDTKLIDDLETVKLTLDPGGADIAVQWFQDTGEFTEIKDPDDHITVQPGNFYSDLYTSVIFEFNLIFHWSYPDEDIHGIKLELQSFEFGYLTKNFPDLYSVENDLDIGDQLTVYGEDDRIVYQFDYVRGGEILTWTDIVVVYQDTADVYPMKGSFAIRIKDEKGTSWVETPAPGEVVSIKTFTIHETRPDGYNYTINITGTPLAHEIPGVSFTIKIDDDPVSFFNPRPSETVNDRFVQIGISVMDEHSLVNASSIQYSYSKDGGTTWSTWAEAGTDLDSKRVDVTIHLTLPDGDLNRIKWRAKDSLGIGPADSRIYEIRVNSSIITLYEVDIRTGVDELRLVPGESEIVVFSVTNLAVVKDSIYVKPEYQSGIGINVEVIGNNTLHLSPGAKADVSVRFRAGTSAYTDADVMLKAESLNSHKYDKNVSDTYILRVKIDRSGIDIPGNGEVGETDDGGMMQLWNAIIGAVIVVFLLILVLIISTMLTLRSERKKVQRAMGKDVDAGEVESVEGVEGATVPGYQQAVAEVDYEVIGPVELKTDEGEGDSVIDLKESEPGIWEEKAPKGDRVYGMRTGRSDNK